MYKITATAPTTHQYSSLRLFGMEIKSHLNGSHTSSKLFDTEKEAKEYLIDRAEKFFEIENELNNALEEIQTYGFLRLDAASAHIEEIDNE